MPRLLDVVESSNPNRICCQQLFASYSARFSPERCNEGPPSAVEALHFLHFRGTAFAGPTFWPSTLIANISPRSN